MNWFKKSTMPQGLARWVLAGWLIAVGLLSILEIRGDTVGAVLDIGAIAAGVLLLLNR